MGQVARKSFVATSVAVAVIVSALAFWHLKVLLAVILLAFILAAAMRPGVERLHGFGIPRGFGVAIHYLGLAIAIGLLLWLIVPRAIGQVQHAIKESQSKAATAHSHGFKHQALVALKNWLKRLPSGGKLVHLSITVTKKALEIIVGIFFMLAMAAYWIFEKEKAQKLVLGLVSRPHRRVVRDTWDLIDAKLGAFVRGQLLMIAFVSSVLSFAFWLDGLPYFLLIGISAGIVEIVPVIGPLAAAIV